MTMSVPYCSEFNVDLKRGDTWEFSPVWNQENGSPYNLTGYTARLQIRESVEATDAVHTLSTAAGSIVLTPLEGKITCTLTAVQSAGMQAKRYVYDLELTSPTGKVITILEGQFNIYADVTRP